MRNQHSGIGSARTISLAAMFTAFSLVVLYFSVIFPNMKFTFYFLSSVFIMGVMVEDRLLAALISYLAASVLALVLLPVGYALPYVILFGHYGIGKYFMEARFPTVIALIAKLAYFDLCLAGIYFAVFYTGLLPMGSVLEKLPIWAWALIAQPLFFVYDFLFSKVTVFYVENIRKKFIRH